MITEEIRKTIIAELPKILKSDKKIQSIAIRLLKERFADKKETDNRIDKILKELAEDRRMQYLKWQEWNKRWEEQKAESDKNWEEQNKNGMLNLMLQLELLVQDRVRRQSRLLEMP